jgi:guanylate kinase
MPKYFSLCILFLCCGDGWVGLSVVNKLLQEFPHLFAKAVTHTTRSPRKNEIPGVHYHFTTREQMEKQIKNGEFIGTFSLSLSLSLSHLISSHLILFLFFDFVN